MKSIVDAVFSGDDAQARVDMQMTGELPRILRRALDIRLAEEEKEAEEERERERKRRKEGGEEGKREDDVFDRVRTR